MDDISLALNPPSYAKTRKPTPIYRGTSRVWPLASLNGRGPVFLDARANQRGVELAYPRLAADDAQEQCPRGTQLGTATHVMPPMSRALSIGDGVISFAGRCGASFAVIIDHANGWASHYSNLETLCAIRTDLYRPREQHLRAGDVIGYVGSPADGDFKRLYFELWRAERSRVFEPIDPRVHLADWQRVESSDDFMPAPPTVQKDAA